MITKIDSIINDVIVREGGFVDHPNDRGGATMYGITIQTLRAWRNDNTLVAKSILSLSKDEAREIYKQEYFIKPRINLIPDSGLMALVFDMAVHSSPATAIRVLQRAVGAKDDGILGAVTLGLLKPFNPQELRKRFLAARMSYIGRLLKDKSQSVFAEGWLNRLGALLIELV